MAPSIAEVGGASSRSTRHNSSAAPKTSSSLLEAPPSIEPSENDAHLAKTFKSDLTTIRGLITCTICDQLLYEPWTLACGHTYCYSCLCQWFKQHQHRKTCPDCRTAVTVMPAPSFTIKQMIEIFISRIELLPPDETVAQHRENIEAERIAVDIDRATEDGLFKGCFRPSNRVHRQWVEEDRIYVCSGCLHEYLPGERRCANCNVLFEDYDPNDNDFLDDMDSFDGDEGQELYDIEVDDDMGIDGDSDDTDNDSFMGHVGHVGAFRMMAMHGMDRPAGHHYRGHVIHLDSGDDNDDEEDDEEDEEDTESLRNFIVSDSPADLGTPTRVDRSSRAASENRHISLSSTDDDSEDEGIIQRRRRHGNTQRIHRVLSEESVSDQSSEYDANISISHRSPVADQPGHGDSESENNYENDEHGGYSPLQGSDDEESDEESDSDTVHELEHEDELRLRDGNSSTSRHSIPTSPYISGVDHSDDEIDQYDTDIDGDVEMTPVPPERGESDDQYDRSSERIPRFGSEELGPAAVFAEDGDDDSDDPIRPPVRRRRQARDRTSAAAARDQDEDVTLTQLFTRPPTGRRTSPTFDSQRILEWHASVRSSPVQQSRNSSLQSRRAEVLASSSTRPSRSLFQHPRRIDRVYAGTRSRHFPG